MERMMTSNKMRLSNLDLTKLGVGKHCDGSGLWLVVRENGGAQWVLRVTVFGKRREMGLGGFPDLSINDARAKATIARRKSKIGIDPIDEKKTKIRKHNFSHSIAKNEREALLDFVNSKKGWASEMILSELMEILSQ
jgi:hypothetical protein